MLFSLGEPERVLFLPFPQPPPHHFLRNKKGPILPDRRPSHSVAMNFSVPSHLPLSEGGREWRAAGGSSGKGEPLRVKCLISPLRQALWHGSCHFNCSLMSFLCPICLSHLTDPPLLLPLVLFPPTFPFPHQILLKHENDFPTWFFMM